MRAVNKSYNYSYVKSTKLHGRNACCGVASSLTAADDIVEPVKLSEGNRDVDKLDDHVENEQVVSVPFAHHATALSHVLTHPRHTALSVLPTVAYKQRSNGQTLPQKQQKLIIMV